MSERRPCGSCGEPTTHHIILRGRRVPACLRHTNHWRTPAENYTCPSECLFANHPRQEHLDWLANGPLTPAPAGDSGGERGCGERVQGGRCTMPAGHDGPHGQVGFR